MGGEARCGSGEGGWGGLGCGVGFGGWSPLMRDADFALPGWLRGIK